ncbi:MAG: hypothetical protein L0241_04810 [Planctomycetia bacterium]|nr:hypothetical protein [Planctomycetia bacterium]
MQYELECGHCGYRFALEERTLVRSVNCLVCGAMLTVAVPVPIIPDEPPTPPAPPPTLPPEVPPPPEPAEELSFPPLVPDRPALGYLNPWERVRHLTPPWPQVYHALDRNRIVTYLTCAFYIFYLSLVLVVLPMMSAAEQTVSVTLLSCMSVIFLLPVAVHAINQTACLKVPATHGGEMVSVSLIVLIVSPLAVLFACLSGSIWRLFIGVAVVTIPISLSFWLAFLIRLGNRLGDHDLKTAAESYAFWFWFGLLTMLALVIGGYLGEQARSGLIAWSSRAGAGVIGLLLLWNYSSLLYTASLAVARRAPVSSGG